MEIVSLLIYIVIGLEKQSTIEEHPNGPAAWTSCLYLYEPLLVCMGKVCIGPNSNTTISTDFGDPLH